MRTIKNLTIREDAEQTADLHGSYWLAKANEQAERGNQEAAEKLYEKGQFWLDRANKLRGWD